MSTITRVHLAGLELALEELALGMDMRKQVEKLIAQARGTPDLSEGITDEHMARIDRGFALSGDDIERFVRLEARAAPEQEPVAWIKADVAATLEGDQCCYAFGSQSPSGNLVPLYTHADPSELVRLAELVATGNDLLNSANQRADVAERKLAVLDKGVLVGRAELSLVRAALKRDAEDRAMPVRGEMLAELDASIERLDALLSASAEPAKGGDGEVQS